MFLETFSITFEERLLGVDKTTKVFKSCLSYFQKDFFSLAVSTVKGFVNSRLDAPALNGVIDVLLNVSKDNPKVSQLLRNMSHQWAATVLISPTGSRPPSFISWPIFFTFIYEIKS